MPRPPDRHKYQKLPKGLTTKEKLTRGLAYTGPDGFELIKDHARETAEREYHGGRYLPAKIISHASVSYSKNWEKIWGKRP